MAKRRTRQFIVIRTIRLVAVSPVMTPKEAKNRLADCTGEGVWEIKDDTASVKIVSMNITLMSSIIAAACLIE